MNAVQFLADRGRSVPLHPVTIHLLDPADPSRVAEAPAVLRFVPERNRIAAGDHAAESLAKMKTPPSTERRDAETAYHFLVEAVRQDGAPSAVFFESVEQAKSMLVDSEAMRLVNEYERYKATHFPDSLSQEAAKKIAEDARNFCLSDLLKSYGYWPILRVLPSLAIACGASLTSTSSPIASAST
jgi:hypothetical protein